MLRSALVSVVLLGCLAAVMANEVGDPPVASAGRCAAPPLLDGRLDDGCWAVASQMGPFVDIRNHVLASQQTRAFAAWDDNYLYLAFDCADAQMDKLVVRNTARDAPNLWTDDVVEVFVSLPESGGYLHWIVNAAGVVLDEECQSQGERDVTWNSALRVATSRGERSWQVELALPWSEILDHTPQAGETVSLNLNREQQARDEWSGWAVTKSGFHEPERFGRLRLVEEDPGLRLFDTGALFMGRNVAVLKPRGNLPGAQVVVTGMGRLIEARWLAEAAVWDIVYHLPGPEPGRVGFAVDRQGEVLFRTAQLPYQMERVDLRVEELKSLADRVRQRMLQVVWPGGQDGVRLRQRVEDPLRRLQTLERRVKDFIATGGRQELWTRIGEQARSLATELQRTNLILSVWAASGNNQIPPCGVGIAPSTVKVLRDLPFQGEVGLRGTLRMCRGEYEALQFVLIPLADDLRDVQVTWGDLRSITGAVIPRDCVEVRRVGYVHTRPPAYKVDYVGWYPDPLMPLDRFSVPVGQNQPLWVAVRTPRDIPAETYEGEIVVRPADAAPLTLTLQVNVWEVTLPQTTTLKTAISNWWTDFAGWYGLTELTPEQRREYYRFWLERRINPGTIYSAPYWLQEDIRWCVDHGMNAFCIKYQGPLGGETEAERAARDQELAQWTRDYAHMLRENGWIDKAYVYGFDEVGPEGYADVVRAYSLIKENAPDLKTACTVVPNEMLNPVIDIWVPLTPALANPGIWRHVDKSDEMWWYVCCGPSHPYANWFVDYSALEHRVLFWQTFKARVTGFLYYATAMWHSNKTTRNEPSYIVPHEDPELLRQIEAGKRWPEVPWNTYTWSRFNGDGHLYYPGPNMTMIPSQRLENIRDGIEDYELLHELQTAADALATRVALRDQPAPTIPIPTPWEVRSDGDRASLVTLLSEARQLLSWGPRLTRNLTHWNDDPQALEAERERVVKQLIRIRRVLQAPWVKP